MDVNEKDVERHCGKCRYSLATGAGNGYECRMSAPMASPDDSEAWWPFVSNRAAVGGCWDFLVAVTVPKAPGEAVALTSREVNCD